METKKEMYLMCLVVVDYISDFLNLATGSEVCLLVLEITKW